MSRLVIPALGAALLALAACGAQPQNASRTGAPASPAADVPNAELRTVTLDVAGMG